MPKVGDNFGVIDSDAVYYYSGTGKYAYPTLECYFSYGNPTFDVDYKKGGIKTIEKSIADRIPLLGNMCEEGQKQVQKRNLTDSFDKYLSKNYLLSNFSNISHVFFYILLACCIIFYFWTNNYNYWIGFLSCFIGGLFLELIQYLFIASRTASWQDQLLNTIGAIIGIIIYWTLDRFKYIEILKEKL
jgi:VanZ family protein